MGYVDGDVPYCTFVVAFPRGSHMLLVKVDGKLCGEVVDELPNEACHMWA